MQENVPVPNEEFNLWERLKECDAQARELLVTQYLPHARCVAAIYYRRRVHDEIGFDEYFQLATLGMMEALYRFDPTLGVSFKTFSSRRMHGAILDGLEKLTEKQQQIAARQRIRKERLESVIVRSEEKCDAHQVEKLFSYLAEVGVGLALSIILDGTGMLDSDTLRPTETDGREANRAYYRRHEMLLLRRKLISHLDGMEPQARHVMKCHYIQEIPFKEIAKSMGLTKGRVSQIHREALLHLRSELKAERSSDLVC